jgi:hypothetical protein
MNFDTFFEEIEKAPINVTVNSKVFAARASLDNEALFQLPFICMTILVIAKGNRRPLVSQLGQLVGECLERSMPSFKGSSQHLGWSANLRVRTVKALGFLELNSLIIVSNRNSKVQLSEVGKKVAQKALDGQDDLAASLLSISREYRNICVARQLEMELIE